MTKLPIAMIKLLQDTVSIVSPQKCINPPDKKVRYVEILMYNA
jgi:hypothetical protein